MHDHNVPHDYRTCPCPVWFVCLCVGLQMQLASSIDNHVVVSVYLRCASFVNAVPYYNHSAISSSGNQVGGLPPAISFPDTMV